MYVNIIAYHVRGRLNVLHTILSKPLGSIITEFKNVGDLEFLQVGDVKYHLGTRGTLPFGDKKVTWVLHLVVTSLLDKMRWR